MEQNTYLGTEMLPDVVPTNDEKTLAILAHILTFVAAILAPLIIYLIKKDESTFVSYHAKESLNFQITVLIVVFVLMISIVGIFLIWIVGLAALAFVIIATIKASEGKLYRYPFSLRLIK
jgi:uncharacterized protein